MATAPTGITVSLPSGSVSEVVSISVNVGGRDRAYTNKYNPEAGSVTIVSFDDPGSTIRQNGLFSVSGTGYSFTAVRGFVDSVDTSVSVGGVTRYTTKINLYEVTEL